MRAEACSGKALASLGTSEAVVALKPSVPGIYHVPIAAFCFMLCVRLVWTECQSCLSQFFTCLVALFQMEKWVFWPAQCPQITLSPARGKYMKVVITCVLCMATCGEGVGWSLQVLVKAPLPCLPHGSVNHRIQVSIIGGDKVSDKCSNPCEGFMHSWIVLPFPSGIFLADPDRGSIPTHGLDFLTPYSEAAHNLPAHGQEQEGQGNMVEEALFFLVCLVPSNTFLIQWFYEHYYLFLIKLSWNLFSSCCVKL